MGAVKIENYSSETLQISETLKALAHPARVEILKFVANNKYCNNGSIVAVLPLAQSTISKHLSELKRSGLLEVTYKNGQLLYTINNIEWSKTKNSFNILTELSSSQKPTLVLKTKSTKKIISRCENLKKYNYAFK